MYNWSVDEEKFKKEDPEGYRLWARNKQSVQKAVDFLSKNQWIIGGKVYVQKQKVGFINESPILISIVFKREIPKYKYVSFGFELDEVIAPTISVIDRDRETVKDISSTRLVGEF